MPSHRSRPHRALLGLVAATALIAGCKSRTKRPQPPPTEAVPAVSIGSGDFDRAREEARPGTPQSTAIATLEARFGPAPVQKDDHHTWRRVDGDTCFELIATFADDTVKAVEVHRITEDRPGRYRACVGPKPHAKQPPRPAKP